MYSKDELKTIKRDFWTHFGQFSQLKRSRLGLDKKWLLYKTDIKNLELKFDFIKNDCFVTIEIDLADKKAQDYIQKINLLKDELTSAEQLTLAQGTFVLENNLKQVYRFYFKKENLSFKTQTHWPIIFNFFFDHMLTLEKFILENKDLLTSS